MVPYMEVDYSGSIASNFNLVVFLGVAEVSVTSLLVDYLNLLYE